MPFTSTTTEDEVKTASEFTQMYNKWFRELVSIEETLLAKADQIQSLQTSLNSEADTLKRLNDNLLHAKTEQNHVEEMLNILVKEQEELEREVSKLDESMSKTVDSESENYEESTELFELLDTQLKGIKEKIKNLVQKINDSKDKCVDSGKPLPMYRTILDHYADALQMLDTNTAEIQQKYDTLHEICLQRCIPPDIFASPI